MLGAIGNSLPSHAASGLLTRQLRASFFAQAPHTPFSTDMIRISAAPRRFCTANKRRHHTRDVAAALLRQGGQRAPVPQ